MSLPAMPLPPESVSFSAEQIARLRAGAGDPQIRQHALDLNAYFEACEYQLIELMYGSNFDHTEERIWYGKLPDNPQPGITDGNFEYGLVPYWLNHPPTDSEWDWVLKVVIDLWKAVAPLPQCLLTVNDTPTVSNYKRLERAAADGLVGDDGTIFGTMQYEQLDLRWMSAVGEYAFHYYQKPPELYHPFVQKKVIVPLKGASPDAVNIAVVGDWGTGLYDPPSDQPAVKVMEAITNLKLKQAPDYILHLGDVYYAGTGKGHILLGDEEKNNLVVPWPKAWNNRSFTLNSNHEMCDGAFGYYEVALQAGSPFGLQQGCSYFALQYGPWNILCLDSAYWSTYSMIMHGSISGPNLNDRQGPWITRPGANAQAEFIRDLNIPPNNVIVMTHHNAITAEGDALVTDDKGNDLWQQVTGALGGAPAAWYWGHIHNGIVYTQNNATNSSTYCRCVGHGAIPFGHAWGVAEHLGKEVSWFANTPVKPESKRLRNGFALLTIHASGQVDETFYDQTGAVTKELFSYQLG